MAVITGEIVRLNASEPVFHAVGSAVLVLQRGEHVASGVVDEDDRFRIEIPSELRGDLQLRLDKHHAAESTVTADGGDIETVILYNNQQHYA